MPFDPPAGSRPTHPRAFRGTGARAQKSASSSSGSQGRSRAGGSAQHKHVHWLAQAAEAERAGDAVQAELCRQCRALVSGFPGPTVTRCCLVAIDPLMAHKGGDRTGNLLREPDMGLLWRPWKANRLAAEVWLVPE
jgi:hypothetical protein